MKNTKKNLFIGVQEIAGFVSRTAESLAGGEVHVIAYKHNHATNHPQPDPGSDVEWLFLDQVKKWSARPKWIGGPMLTLYKFAAFIVAAARADACLFIGGKGFLQIPLDYLLLRLFRTRVVHMYVGTASRPRYMSSNAKSEKIHDPVKKGTFFKKLASRVRRQSARVRMTSRAANTVIENPLCAHFQTGHYINYFKIGMPISLPPAQSSPKSAEGAKIRILHCPSKPSIKGTARIKEVLNDESLAGLNAELTVLTGVPHAHVIEEIERSDFVIDQLYSDSPLTGFAAEAASRGKLPVVGGYGWDELRATLDESEFPPSAACHPDELLDVVTRLCSDLTATRAQGLEVRDFLEKGFWSQCASRARLLGVLLGEKVDHYLCDPRNVTYTQGVGLSDDESKTIVSGLIAECGIEALRLDPSLPALAEFSALSADGTD